MEAPEIKYFTEKEYLDIERAALDKHEFYKGEIFAMSGASIPHNIIFSNLFGELSTKLNGKNCMPFGSDLRIHIPKNTLYTYPDISIICGEIETTDDKFDTVTNPSVIIEIRSENYDKGGKFTLYREIESLKEYLLIDSEAVMVEKFIKNADNSWQFTEYKKMEEHFTIETVAIQMELTTVYQGVKFKN